MHNAEIRAECLVERQERIGVKKVVEENIIKNMKLENKNKNKNIEVVKVLVGEWSDERK